MDAWLSALAGRNGFLPHGYCFNWSPELVWTMVIGDAGIAAAYFAIPAALVHFVRKRGSLDYKWIVLLFSLFIVACGATHVLSIWTVWSPMYGLEASLKLFTAAVSLLTAALLWPLIPKILALPTVRQLRDVIDSLEREVAKHQHTQAELVDTQESLAVTLASIGAGLVAVDRAGRITRMNPVAEQITGWPAGEAMGRSLWDVWRNEGLPEHFLSRSVVDLVLEQRFDPARLHRLVAVSRQGRRTAVEVKAALTFSAEQRVNGMAFVFRDMTRLDAAEFASHELTAIVASSTDAIVCRGLDGRITSWNQGAEQMFGYTADEMVGQPGEVLIPQDRREEEEKIRRSLEAGTVEPAYKTVRRRKDDSLLDVSITISPVRDAKGRLMGFATIARDITHEVRSERLRLDAIRLEAENRQIQEANRLKSQFIANMSHELRTPLNAIIGFADLMHMGRVPPDSPQFKEFVGHIRNSGRHLLRLINEVLDLSKVESGKLEFAPTQMDVKQVAEEVLATLGAEATRKGINLSAEVAEGISPVLLDPLRFKQVLYNFVSNGIKFTSEGGSVQVRCRPEGSHHFRVEVEDSGIGIAPESLERLFKEFVQLDGGASKQYEGTGLGLALTRSLVEAQGGKVGVRSEQGKGSVFHAILPRVHVAHPSGSLDREDAELLDEGAHGVSAAHWQGA